MSTAKNAIEAMAAGFVEASRITGKFTQAEVHALRVRIREYIDAFNVIPGDRILRAYFLNVFQCYPAGIEIEKFVRDLANHVWIQAQFDKVQFAPNDAEERGDLIDDGRSFGHGESYSERNS